MLLVFHLLIHLLPFGFYDYLFLDKFSLNICRETAVDLVCNEGGRWVLRGAVSWGHEYCRTDYFTVFARVSTFTNWIRHRTGL